MPLTTFKRMDYFGEIGFFSDQTRTATIKSRDFTDLLYIDRPSFLEIGYSLYPESIVRT